MTSEKSLLEPAWKKFEKQDLDGTILLAEQFKEDANTSVKREANKLIALAKFRQLKFSEAEKIFNELAQGSENSDDWFNVVTSAALNKNVDLSKIAFDNAVHFYQIHQTKGNLGIPFMAFYYILALRDVKEYERAFEQFGLLRDIYASVSITDSHFLYIRGIPSFETAITEAKIIFENNPKESVIALFTYLTKKVDEYGAKFIEEYMTTLKL
ncbi:MAG: hypothetical protein H0U95_18585 [Bacteroidetes bacterium]|nr:hypothetical protein [Bacteroidota bacterium]